MLWTEHDRNHLHALWQHHTIGKIARLLGRSPASVRSAVDRYQLRRAKVNGWSDAEIARLQELWPHYPASVIAVKLDRTRNAVLGEVFRRRKAGLVFQHQPARPPPKSDTASPPRPPRTRPKAKVLFMRQPTRPIPRSIQCPCQLVDLERINCRWPYGDPHTDDFHFCGARVMPNRPYCPAHLVVAHTPDKKMPPVRGIAPAARNVAFSDDEPSSAAGARST